MGDFWLVTDRRLYATRSTPTTSPLGGQNSSRRARRTLPDEHVQQHYAGMALAC